MKNCNNKIKNNCGTIVYAECVRYEGEVSDNSSLKEKECINLSETTEDIYNQLETLSNKIITNVSVNDVEPDETNNIEIDSDDVPQGSVNLYVTTEEKETWNGKQDLLEGDGVVKSTDGVISYLADTTVGANILTSTDPSAITFLRANTDNSVSWLNAAAFRTAIGAGTGSADGTVTSVAALTLGTTGTDLNSSVADSTTTPVITLNVPNASATNRGVLTTADWSTFNGKAGLASPAFTGIPTAPTASPGTSTTQLATTAFVTTAIAVHATSGTYAPVVTNGINSTLTVLNGTCSYLKIGNIVTVTIAFSTTITAANTLTRFNVTLPVNKTTAIVGNGGQGTINHPTNTGAFFAATTQSVSTSSFDVYYYPTANGPTSGTATFQYSTAL